VAEADLAPYLERVRDGALRHALEYGVAFLHETQAPAEQEVVNTLFASGAIQARAQVSGEWGEGGGADSAQGGKAPLRCDLLHAVSPRMPRPLHGCPAGHVRA